MSNRIVHRAAAVPNRDIASALQSLFLSECITPSSRILAISPWISDFPVLDNRASQLSYIESTWPATWIRFSQVLRALLKRRVEVWLACGPGPAESEFADALIHGAELDSTVSGLHLSRLPRSHRLFSHEKALVTENWAVYGSMNLTYSGVELNGELITLTDDPELVSILLTELTGLFE